MSDSLVPDTRVLAIASHVWDACHNRRESTANIQ